MDFFSTYRKNLIAGHSWHIFNGLKNELSLNEIHSSDEIDFPCLKSRFALYEKNCGSISEYGLKYVDYIHLSCAQKVENQLFEAQVAQICSKYQKIETNDI